MNEPAIAPTVQVSLQIDLHLSRCPANGQHAVMILVDGSLSRQSSVRSRAHWAEKPWRQRSVVPSESRRPLLLQGS